MSNFTKYQHIERLNHQAVAGILNGKCYIFPKLDGTNGSVWYDNGKICAGSRNRVLTLENDNAGFYAYVLQNEAINKYFDDINNQSTILYGEWLVPHSVKNYRSTAWRKFYIFDILETNDNKYIRFDLYQPRLEHFGLDYIHCLGVLENPTTDDIEFAANHNNYLMERYSDTGEGVVIKNYDYVNQYGKVIWAKFIHNEFVNVFKTGEKQKSKLSVEQKIIDKYCTESEVIKEYYKLVLTEKHFDNKHWLEILNRVYHNILTDNIIDIISKFKTPIIDFKHLQKLCFDKTKEIINNILNH
jgi:hypothetical protein